ncbi:HesA/MoeB/ThiF family protein [Vibrio rumoiensis]|uniref:Molybdopterin-synthase adenylyltransferase MoeB n=1 Tax=Vibrio rumoiensis 1S-45 TaxID=1188252 RepID=A0A1E5E3U8_9VIBR|nr:HesA/MoeB/ThiF family protein [Vibrio rumoiensis]OEF27186.1 molybdopterin-synthase adenylyltransferase MoeB [Vibrio rumoiensis 1S-45]
MNDQQFQRYQRQIMVPEVGETGQDKLIGSKVLLIGCGGLGSAAALYLAGAGIGSMVVADGDTVESSNLQRQIIYREADLGKNKALATAEHLKHLNPHIKVRSVQTFLEEGQLNLEIMMADVVLDCSDNFPTRQAINKACHSANTPLISGSAIGWVGQLMTFDFTKSHSPCYRCAVPYQDNSAGLKCSESGVIGPIVGLLGNLQAVEAIKLITGNGNLKPFTLNLFDGQTLSWQCFNIARDAACPVCGD